MDGETKWNVALPKLVKGKKIVIKMVKKAIIIKGILGIFALPKKWKVLTENISTISVKMLTINQRVWSKEGSTLWKMPKKMKSKIVLTRAKRMRSEINLFNWYSLGFLSSSTSTLSEATAMRGKSDKRLTNKIWVGNIGKKGIAKEIRAIE